MNKSSDEATRSGSELERLINRAVEGDSQARSTLLGDPFVRGRVALIARAVFSRYGSRQVFTDAEDLEQEVYKKMLSEITNFRDFHRGEREFFAWVSVLTKYVYLNSLRSKSSQRKNEPSVIEVEPTTESTQEAEVLAREVVERLNAKELQIVEMRVEGYSLREIAESMNISKMKAQRILIGALKKMAGEIGKSKARLQISQREIEQEKALTRDIIDDIRF